MEKEQLLQRIANTIVSNLNGTDDVGLFYGKMGACLFLYAYARYLGRKQYESMAEQLLREAYVADKQHMMAGISEGYGGIGVGLCWLRQNGFLPDDAAPFFALTDRLLIKEAQKCLRSDRFYAAPYYSSAVYLRWRKQICREVADEAVMQAIEASAFQFSETTCPPHKTTHPIDTDELWWNFVLQKPCIEMSLDEIRNCVDRLQGDFVYEMPKINGRLAILGLSLLPSFSNKNI